MNLKLLIVEEKYFQDIKLWYRSKLFPRIKSTNHLQLMTSMTFLSSLESWLDVELLSLSLNFILDWFPIFLQIWNQSVTSLPVRQSKDTTDDLSCQPNLHWVYETSGEILFRQLGKLPELSGKEILLLTN